MRIQKMQRQAIRIYWYASLVAVAEAFVLFTLGLDLRQEQVLTLLLFGFPAPLLMYLCDRRLIVRHLQPIVVVQAMQSNDLPIAQDTAQSAYVQALNLPVLTLLRVLTVHAPCVLLPATLLVVLANQVAGLGFTWWQFFVIWSLWPITAAPHAIVEYMLMERLMRGVLERLEPLLPAPLLLPVPTASRRIVLRLLAGKVLPVPHLIRTSTGTQLAWIFFFVSLMPMCVLGSSVYLKIALLPVPPLQTMAALGPWLLCLISLNTLVGVAIVTLLSRRIHDAMTDLLGQMQRILDGDLSGHWSPRSTDEFFDLGMGFNAMLGGLRERQTLKDTFGRFVSRDVADAVLAGDVALQGEMRQVTILFQDIRGFTTLSEKTPPDDLLRFINAFFTEMVAAVEAYGGVVKQFTGDGVMALFGAPVAHEDDPIRAVRAALAMLTRLEAFNRRRQEHGEAAIRIGIGIHSGEVVAGCVGPDKRLEYAVVGDAVNLASRVQELTKEVGSAILVTAATATHLGRAFSLGPRAVFTVRGKALPVEVFAVLGEER